MHMNAEFAMSPTIAEQAQLNRAAADGSCWIMPVDVPGVLTEGLKVKGLIRFRDGGWRLTPLGLSYTPHLAR
jgi:hypothetical protein